MNNILNDTKLSYFLDKLKIIYEKMDLSYKKISDGYGFECRGCEDNCCKSHFYHHTYLEYFYILRAYNYLEMDIKEEIKIRAKKQRENLDKKLFCPLNFNDKCLLYDFRPMICRLHGIPYKFSSPNNKIITGTGCLFFEEKFLEKDLKLDRTIFYIEIANLEKEFRGYFQIQDKIKKTISDFFIF